jgi:hypothetical protein
MQTPQERGEIQAEELYEILARARSEIVSQFEGDTIELSKSWDIARNIVQKFDPVPWFVRRLSQISLAKEQIGKPVPSGAVVGLDKLLCLAANDAMLGSGNSVVNATQAKKVLRADEFAAVAIVHSICRRLKTPKFQKMWYPLLDQALVSAQIGYCLGVKHPDIGGGKGLLGGFAFKIGLLILMVNGTQTTGNRCLDKLMKGVGISEIGTKLYNCDPLYVSACILTAIGCGGDSALGLIAYSSCKSEQDEAPQNQGHKEWFTLIKVLELIRLNRSEEVLEDEWNCLGFDDRAERHEVEDVVQLIKRRGHGWRWLL